MYPRLQRERQQEFKPVFSYVDITRDSIAIFIFRKLANPGRKRLVKMVKENV